MRPFQAGAGIHRLSVRPFQVTDWRYVLVVHRVNMRKILPQLIILALIGLLVFVYFIPQIFITIRPGEAGVHFRRFFGGTVTDVVYGEGLQIIFPWDVMYVYNVRIQEKERVLDVLTKEGLNAKVSISIRYYPEYDLLGVLHKRVGVNYADEIVIPEVESALRTEIGKLTAEELYTTSDDAITEVIVDALKQLADTYIVINKVIIQKIELPPVVQDAIQQKIQQKHIAESFVFKIEGAKKEAVRKEIEARGFAAYNDVINKSLTPNILKWKGVDATKELAASPNAKIIVIGNGPAGMPIILGSEK
jgi:regulator of protease activity HflC (stomatin/prohibitin superfamily)